MTQSRSIYVVRSEPGPVKVGIAGRVARRLSQLRVSSAVPLHLFFCAETDDDVALLERQTHQILSDSHMTGEWFNVTAQEAAHAVVQAAKDLGFILREPMPTERKPQNTEKRRGPKPTGKGTLIGVRLQPDMLVALDAAKDDPSVSRPELIRQIVKDHLLINGFLRLF